MPNPILGKAILELATDDAALSKGLDVAKAKAQGWSQSVSGAGKAAAIAIAGVGAAAGAIVGSMVASAQSVANQAGEVAKLKREMGLTTEEASKLKYAAGRLNIDTDSLSKSFGILSKSLESAHPSLEKYNIEVVRAKDGHIDMEATLGNVADRFKAMPDGVEKTALSLDIFGKSGKDMLPLLNKGADGLKAMGDEAAKLGLVFDDKTLASAKRLSMAHKDLDDRLEGLRNRIGIAFLPMLADWMGGLVKAADVVLPALGSALSTATTIITNVFGPAFTTAARLAGLAFDAVKDLFTNFQKDPSVVGDIVGNTLYSMFGVHLPNAVSLFIAHASMELAKLPGFIGQVVGSIGEMFDVATGRDPAAGGVLRSLVGDAKASGIMGTLASVRNAVEGFAAFIVGKFEQARDKLGPIIAGLLEKFDTLRDRFDALPKPVRDYIETIAVAGAATKVFGDPVLSAAGNIGNLMQGIASFVLMKGPIAAVGAAVEAFALQVALAGGGAGGIFAAIITSAAFIPVMVALVVGGLVFIGTHLDDLKAIADAVGYGMGAVFSKIGTFVHDTLTAAGQAIGGFFSTVGTFAQGAVSTVGGAFSAIGTFVSNVLGTIGEFVGFWLDAWAAFTSRPVFWIGAMIGLVLGGLLNLAQGIGDFSGGAVRLILGWLGETKTAIWNFFTGLPDAIGGFLGGVFSAIGTFADGALAAIGHWIGGTKETTSTFWSSLPDQIGGWLGDVWMNFLSFAGTFKAAVGDWLGETWTSISGFFTTLPGRFFEFATQAIQGLIEGFGSMKDAIWSSVQDLVGGVIDGVKAALGWPHSPAPAFIPLGRTIPQGLTEGITQTSGGPASALAALGSSMRGVMTNEIGRIAAGAIGTLRSVGLVGGGSREERAERNMVQTITYQPARSGIDFNPATGERTPYTTNAGFLTGGLDAREGNFRFAGAPMGGIFDEPALRDLLHLPSFGFGGRMLRDGLAFLHGGEEVTSAAELRNGGRVIHTHVYLNSREIALAVGDEFNGQGILAGSMAG